MNNLMRTKKLFILKILFFALWANFCATAADADSRLIAPDKIAYPELKFDLPKAERVVLENGIVLYIMEDHELPIVNINALFRTGSIYDPPGKEGVAELVAFVMRTGGTKKLAGDEIDRRLDSLAASISFSMSTEHATGDLSVLSKDIDEALDYFSQMIISPAFEKCKLNIVIQLKIEDLRRLQDNPQRLALREFNRLIYQNDARGRLTTQQSLRAVTRCDLRKFHQKFFRPQNAMFAVTGDITREQAIDLFTKYFGSWKKDEALGEPPALPPPPFTPGLYYLHKAIPQSTIVTGQFAPGKHHPDYYAFALLDFIAGSGGFNSRIFDTVRNNEGLAYSAGSFYRARPSFGVFGTYAFTKTSSTHQALALILETLKKIKKGTITPKELSWAKQSVINSFIFSFTNAEQIATQQMMNEFEKMPPDYLDAYRDNIKKVSLDDLRRVANSVLKQENNIILILGDTQHFDRPTLKLPAAVMITPLE